MDPGEADTVSERGPADRGEPVARGDDLRGVLGGAQAELLAALVAGARAPEGFDAGRLAVQARALAVKRGRIAAAHHPWLVDALGAGYGVAFAAYAGRNPLRAGGTGHEDAEGFEAYLRGRGELPRRPRRWFRGRK